MFYIPEPLARGYKIRNEFHKILYEMKIHVRFFLSHAKLTKTQEKHSFIEFYYQFNCGKRANVEALPMLRQLTATFEPGSSILPSDFDYGS